MTDIVCDFLSDFLVFSDCSFYNQQRTLLIPGFLILPSFFFSHPITVNKMLIVLRQTLLLTYKFLFPLII